MKKFSWKTLVVAILFVCLIGYSIFSLNALPSTPVEADFDSTEAFSQAMDQYLANKKQVHAYITVGVLCVSALGFALEAAPVAVIAMVMPIFFGLTGILPVSEAFSGFSNPTTNISAVFACFNNIGPGLEAVGPTCNFSQYSDLSKLVLSWAMLAGRLEIFPMLILFSRGTWKKR